MAIGEIQSITKDELFTAVQSVAGEVRSRGVRWELMYDFLVKLDAATLTDLGITDSQTISDLVAFRTAISNIVSLMNGEAVSPSEPISDVMDRVRKMLII